MPWFEIGIWVVFGVGIIATLCDTYLGYLIFLASLVAIGKWILNLDVWEWFKSDYLLLIWYAIAYFALGFSWSVVKWYLFVKKEFKLYLKEKKEYIKSELENIPNITNEEAEKNWQKYSKIRKPHSQPKPNYEKETIIGWIVRWPSSMIHYIVGDFIVWIGKKVYELSGKIYNKISEKIYSEIEGR
jgi:hypothetical protein